jgi:pilus assembly protein CpaB
MKRGQVIALGLAAASGLGAVMMARSLTRPAPPPPPVVEKVQTEHVLVARSDIGLGHVATEANFTWQEWPKDAVARSFITRQARPQAISDLTGTVARVPMTAGEPVNENKLVKPGEGGVLAALLKPGMRAVSIRIEEKTAVGGLVLPNDHVDVLVVRTSRNKTGEEQTSPQTLLRNVRILAIGQTIESKDGKRTVDGKTATLELSPEHAETLVHATSSGEFVLALRSVADIAAEGTVAPVRTSTDAVRVIRYGTPSTYYSVN